MTQGGRSIHRMLAELSAGAEEFEKAITPRLLGWWRLAIEWPPNVFAATSTLLAESGAYRLAVSPLPGHRWPPRADWNAWVDEHGRVWWEWVAADCAGPPPEFLLQLARKIRCAGAVEVNDIADSWSLTCAILELHALADEASASFGIPPDPADPDEAARSSSWKEYRARANDLLGKNDTLSNFSSTLMQVLPKMRTPQTGIALRSLSQHLAIARFPEVDVLWSHVQAFANEKSSINLLLLPVPLEVSAGDFQPVAGPLDNMDRHQFGFFRFEPRPLDVAYVRKMLAAGSSRPGGVDGIVLPELAISESELQVLKDMVEEAFFIRSAKVPFLLAGVRSPRGNRAHFAVRRGKGDWVDYPQAKHHRWCLDRSQILNYRLGGALHPSTRWWEDIDVTRRKLRFIVANSWLGICPLICEDLARQDPVGQIIRSLGPTLVIALLLDGPQLGGRWPGRYASVLADDPGSSVLTFTPLGMSTRSVPPGEQPKRVVGLWKDAKNGARELALEAGATALLLTLCNEWAVEWMADGRHDGGAAAQLYLGHVEQLS
jgi:hypothetical protein